MAIYLDFIVAPAPRKEKKWGGERWKNMFKMLDIFSPKWLGPVLVKTNSSWTKDFINRRYILFLYLMLGI